MRTGANAAAWNVALLEWGPANAPVYRAVYWFPSRDTKQ